MHSIIVYIARKKDIRENRIDTLLQEENTLETKELGSDIVAILSDINPEEFSKGRMVAKIETDYFGGFGEQSATLWENGEITYQQDTMQNDWLYPINDVLRVMGVKAEIGMDEFDTIGLGRYRKNEDFHVF